MQPYKSVRMPGLLEVNLPVADVPSGRGWRLYTGNAEYNSWVKLPLKPSKRASAQFRKLAA